MTPVLSTALAWLLVVMIPGPNFVVVSQRSAGVSRLAGLSSAAGVTLGACIWAAAALVGLSEILQETGSAFRILRLLGAAVLLVFGLRLLISSRRNRDFGEPSASTVPTASGLGVAGGSAAKGLASSLSNPKTAVYFGSLYLVSIPASPSLSLQVSLLAAVAAISMAWYGVVALALSADRVASIYRSAGRHLDAVAGVILAGLGLHLGIKAFRSG